MFILNKSIEFEVISTFCTFTLVRMIYRYTSNCKLQGAVPDMSVKVLIADRN